MRRRVARASPAGGADADLDDDTGRAGRRERGDDDEIGEGGGGRRGSDDVFPTPKVVAKRAPPSAGFALGLKRKPASRAGGGKGGPGKRRS